MALDKTIIAAGPASARKQNREVVIRFTNVIPPDPYLRLEPNGSVTSVPQTPEREGQMVTYRPSTNSAYAATMFVVVDIDGTLVWKQVVTNGTFKDANTGRDWDPNAQFFRSNF